jgi:CPA2 family monovalent cation:H+ antiporter-2
MGLGFLESLVVIFGVSVIVVFILYRFKIPSLVGFLVAGIIIGPHGIALINNIEEIEIFAEIGVILLLFALGMEFSLAKLLKMKRIVFGAGSFQVIFTILVTFLLAFLFMNLPLAQAIFWGFIITLSSTAIVIKYLNDNNELQTPHGRSMIGIVLFQDICVVFFMILIPIMGGQTELNSREVAMLLLRTVAIIGFVIIGSKWVVPYVFDKIIKTQSRELFIISIILFCVGTAVFTHNMGLSISLGAFLAGMMLSESDYAYQATADILPFKESFMGLFFVSVGMLLNLNFAFTHGTSVIILVLMLFIVKAVIALLATRTAGFSYKTAIISGLGLAQIGEFSFVLAMEGRLNNLISENHYQIFIAASIISMIGAPFVMRYSSTFAAFVLTKINSKSLKPHQNIINKEFIRRGSKTDHVIIIGFGFNGKNLAKVLKDAKIPYVIADSDMSVVKKYKVLGEPIYFGDANSTEILENLGLRNAKMVVCTISNAITQRIIISFCRMQNAHVHIVVRTRYIKAVEELKRLGANEVIPEEYETSIEIFHRVLAHYNISEEQILSLVELIRNNNYSALRETNFEPNLFVELKSSMPDFNIRSFTVKNNMKILGRSIRELDIRNQTGVTILGIKREFEVITNPEPDLELHENDIVIYTGNNDSLQTALAFFKN